MSRHESEIPTPWGVRLFLLAHAVVSSVLTYAMWADPIGRWIGIAGSAFCWVCFFTCWKTIIVGEPEWHDYR